MNTRHIIGGQNPLYIYNSLSGRKEVLKSLKKDSISIYVCGMTVYDYCHLGHARVLVVFDTVVRYLRSLGIAVRYIRNITDIDDKIIARAKETSEPEEELTERFIQAMHEDEALINVKSPDQEPRATKFVGEIIELIDKLEQLGYAYQGNDGDVYFRVRSFSDYGKLSKRSIDQLKSGERVHLTERKEDPLDFALWKSRKKGEPFWNSPWGPGRPGWHIECSAMSMQCLGETFDIHAGGLDLKFPHHENEIAQSESVTGKQFVNYWMHNGYVEIDQEKMSKSTGNFHTIRDILSQDASPKRMGEIVRFMILASHYRSPLNFSEDTLANARASLTRFYRCLANVENGHSKYQFSDENKYDADFHAAMKDDFNTADAISILFNLVREINRLWDSGQTERAGKMGQQLLSLGNILGLLYQSPRFFLTGLSDFPAASGSKEIERIEQRVNDRLVARREGNWGQADQIRMELRDQGVVLEDKEDGTTVWRRE